MVSGVPCWCHGYNFIKRIQYILIDWLLCHPSISNVFFPAPCPAPRPASIYNPFTLHTSHFHVQCSVLQYYTTVVHILKNKMRNIFIHAMQIPVHSLIDSKILFSCSFVNKYFFVPIKLEITFRQRCRIGVRGSRQNFIQTLIPSTKSIILNKICRLPVFFNIIIIPVSKDPKKESFWKLISITYYN